MATKGMYSTDSEPMPPTASGDVSTKENAPDPEFNPEEVVNPLGKQPQPTSPVAAGANVPNEVPPSVSQNAPESATQKYGG